MGIYPSGGKYCVESFFWTVVNAAYGISSQVSAAVYRFLGSFQTAVNPQLIKEYAQGNVMGMMGLAYRGMKFSFFLLLFIAYPLVLEMDFILSRWLGTVPELAPAFCRLVVANALLDILSSLFATLAKAYGKDPELPNSGLSDLILEFSPIVCGVESRLSSFYDFCGLLHCFDALGDYTLPIDRWYV